MSIHHMFPLHQITYEYIVECNSRETDGVIASQLSPPPLPCNIVLRFAIVVRPSTEVRSTELLLEGGCTNWLTATDSSTWVGGGTSAQAIDWLSPNERSSTALLSTNNVHWQLELWLGSPRASAPTFSVSMHCPTRRHHMQVHVSSSLRWCFPVEMKRRENPSCNI